MFPVLRAGFWHILTLEVRDMPDMFNFSPDMQQYFNSLPIFVQETLKQNNVKVNSLEDLKACAENMLCQNTEDK